MGGPSKGVLEKTQNEGELWEDLMGFIYKKSLSRILVYGEVTMEAFP